MEGHRLAQVAAPQASSRSSPTHRRRVSDEILWKTGDPALCVRRFGATRVRLEVENLESRIVPYALGGAAWPHPEMVTLSFVPDGTIVGTNSYGYVYSNLFAKMNAKFGSPSVWEAEIVRRPKLGSSDQSQFRHRFRQWHRHRPRRLSAGRSRHGRHPHRRLWIHDDVFGLCRVAAAGQQLFHRRRHSVQHQHQLAHRLDL